MVLALARSRQAGEGLCGRERQVAGCTWRAVTGEWAYSWRTTDDRPGGQVDTGDLRPVLRSKFNIPRISFRYLASLNLTLAVQITSTMKLVINLLSQLWVFQLQVRSCDRGGVLNYEWHHQNHEWSTSYNMRWNSDTKYLWKTSVLETAKSNIQRSEM